MREVVRRRLRLRPVGEPDSGMSLAELIVYMVLSTIVLTLVASIFSRAMSAQQLVRDRSEASSSGQAFIDSFRRVGQNSVQVYIPSSKDLVVAQTRRISNDIDPDDTDPANFMCVAWRHDPETQTVRIITDPAAFPYHDGMSLPEGTVVLDHVVAGADGAFAERDGLDGVKVNISIVNDHDESLATLSTTVVMRPQGQALGAEPCF